MTTNLKLDLVKVMSERFGRYSKYIIQDRALPDIRDGLKPVQRRILYSMYKERNLSTNPYRKSAKTVGNVIGNYHPHGDTSVYDALVRMAQEWKLNMPLIDMHGNKGSIDNDPAAAMRYTEARMSKIAGVLLQDIDKKTVDFIPNFDDTEMEPTVLPARFPNLLVNGSTGISAGYATNIPPHNIEEVINATIHRISNPLCKLRDIMKHMKGPDFPTGGIIQGKKGILEAFTKGKGKVILRGKVDVEVITEKKKSFKRLVITEIPYEVVKGNLLRKLEDIRLNNQIDGIIEVRDESGRDGLRIVIDIDDNANVDAILNYFYKYSELQVSYNYNMVVINKKRPMLCGLLEILDSYIEYQKEVITYRTRFDLKKAKDRLHIIDGLVYMVSILDEVIATIRASENKADAINNLVTAFGNTEVAITSEDEDIIPQNNHGGFSKIQAEAIVNLQLYRLTNTDVCSLEQEARDLTELTKRLELILADKEVLKKVLIEELKEVLGEYGIKRRTKLDEEVSEVKIDVSSLIIEKKVSVSFTKRGYLKVVNMEDMHTMKSYGKKDDDYITHLFTENNTSVMLLFTNKGRYIFRPIYDAKDGSWKKVGEHISSYAPLASDEEIISAFPINDFEKEQYVFMVTKSGTAKKVLLKEFQVSRYSKPMQCIKVKDDDEVVNVFLTENEQEIILTTKKGRALRYHEKSISIMGLKAAGMKAINLYDGDEVVSTNVVSNEKYNFIVVLSDGNIKKFRPNDIPAFTRTSKGTRILKIMKRKPQMVVNTLLIPSNESIIIRLEDNKIETIDNIHSQTRYSDFDNIGSGIVSGNVIEAGYTMKDDHMRLHASANIEEIPETEQLELFKD